MPAKLPLRKAQCIGLLLTHTAAPQTARPYKGTRQLHLPKLLQPRLQQKVLMLRPTRMRRRSLGLTMSTQPRTHQHTPQVAQKGDARHEQLPQDHQDPRVQGGWDEEEAKDAPLSCSADVVVHHNEAKNEPRRSYGTLVCQLCSEPA